MFFVLCKPANMELICWNAESYQALESAGINLVQVLLWQFIVWEEQVVVGWGFGEAPWIVVTIGSYWYLTLWYLMLLLRAMPAHMDSTLQQLKVVGWHAHLQGGRKSYLLGILACTTLKFSILHGVSTTRTHNCDHFCQCNSCCHCMGWFQWFCF